MSVPILSDILNAFSLALYLNRFLYSANVAGLFLVDFFPHVRAHIESEPHPAALRGEGARMFQTIGRSQRCFASGLLVAASTFMYFGLTIAVLSKILSQVFFVASLGVINEDPAVANFEDIASMIVSQQGLCGAVPGP